MSQEAVRRAARARDRQALGAPLTARVRSAAIDATTPGSARVVSSPHAAGAALSAASIVLLVAGAPIVAVAAAAPILYAVGFLVARGWRRRRVLTTMESELALAGAFDAFVQEHVTRLPDEAGVSLQRIKATLARVLPRMQNAQARAALGPDDAFFVSQTVTRYLPDAVQPFLALPPDRAGLPLAAHGKSALELLIEQLGIVERELARIEDLMLGAEADRLARNRALLERRRSG